MKKEAYKKFMIAGIITVFLLSATIPTINAVQIDTNLNKIKTEISDQTEIETKNACCDLLIITADEFANLLKPLKCHKEKYGVRTSIVTLSYIYDNIWYGYDKPEKIKYFIKQAIEEAGIKYVMLVGDYRKIPIRYVYNDEPRGFLEPCFISELYYADIYDSEGNFSSWDTDGNGIYGQWVGDEAQDKDIDLRPDVYVGRLACRNKLEVRIMVNKIITYETTTYDSDWFNRIIVAGGDTYPDGHYEFPTPEMEGEESCELILENMSDFEPIRLYTSNGNFSGPEDMINAVNNGAGFMSLDGHASPIVWATHAPNNTAFIYGLKFDNMWLLRNKNKMPVVVAGACHNGQFDIGLENILKLGFNKKALNGGLYFIECWGWKLTSKFGGGAIATIANTGLGMTKEDKSSQEGAGDYMDKQFFYVYGHDISDILGEIWGISLNRYLDKYPIDWNTPAGWDFSYDAKTVQEWVLFGDPSLKIGGYPPLE